MKKLKQYFCHGKSENSEIGQSNFLVSLEVLSVMRPRRISRRVILEASLTTVLVLCIVFIITYTIILKYVDHHLPDSSDIANLASGWSQGGHGDWAFGNRRIKILPKTSYGGSRHSFYKTKLLSEDKVVKWNIGNYDDIFSEKPNCETEMTYLVIITSSPEHSDRRDAIRRTWCNPKNYNLPAASWQCVFLVGHTDHRPSQIIVDNEISQFKDILKGSYMDSYRNLTYKVFHGFYWASKFCPAPYVLKTDDDCFVNTRLLHHLLTHFAANRRQNLYVGKIYTSLEKRVVIRKSVNRWSVSMGDYPETHYPPYASGTGYLISHDLIDKLIEASRFIKPIPNEDAYVGIMMQELGVKPEQSSRFTLFNSGWSICNYLYLLIIHDIQPAQQDVMHNNAVQAPSVCEDDEELNTWS